MMKFIFIVIFSLINFVSNTAYAQWAAIGGLEDITLAKINTSKGKTRKAESPACAYEIFDSDNKYWIEVDDGFSDGILELRDSVTGETIPMRVRWKQASGRYKRLDEDIPKRFNGTTGIINCTSGANAAVEIRVLKADTAGIFAGTYTATLNITMHARNP